LSKHQVEILYTFYKNNFIRTRGSFLLKIENNPNLGRRTKSQIFKVRTNICN